jgi:hypothetical protein
MTEGPNRLSCSSRAATSGPAVARFIMKTFPSASSYRAPVPSRTSAGRVAISATCRRSRSGAAASSASSMASSGARAAATASRRAATAPVATARRRTRTLESRSHQARSSCGVSRQRHRRPPPARGRSSSGRARSPPPRRATELRCAPASARRRSGEHPAPQGPAILRTWSRAGPQVHHSPNLASRRSGALASRQWQVRGGPFRV